MGGDHKKEEPTIDPEIDNEEIIDDVEEIVIEEKEDAGIDDTKGDLVDKVIDMAKDLVDDGTVPPLDEDPTGSDDDSKDDEFLQPVDEFVLPGDEDPSGDESEEAREVHEQFAEDFGGAQ